MAGIVTFNWVKPVIRAIRRQKAMYMSNIHPISNALKSKQSGQLLASQWNSSLQQHIQTRKPMHSLLKMIFIQNKAKLLWLILFVPLTSLCNICAPIAVKRFTSVLVPQVFFNCDTLFSSNPEFEKLNYQSGLSKVFDSLWGYLVLILASQLLSVIIQNISYSVVIKAAIQGVNGLMDIIYQKILLLSD